MTPARDLMTENPMCFSRAHHVSKLVDLILDNKIASVPIVDENKRLLGVFTDFEITRIFITHHYNEKIKREQDIIANYEKHMINAPKVYEDDSVAVILRELTNSPIHRVFVVNRKNETLIGIISPFDVLNFLKGESKDTDKMMDIFGQSQSEILKLKMKVSNLKNQVEHYKGHFDNSPYLMHSLNSKGVVVMANRKMHQALGYGNGEMIGMPFKKLYPENQFAYAKKGLRDIIENKVNSNKLSSFVKRDGTIIYVDIASAALRNEKGAFVSTISISRVVQKGPLQDALAEEKYIDME